MTTSTYSSAASELMGSINRDVNSVLGNEAKRIAQETLSLSIQPEHILEALQRVIRMRQTQQAETKHQFPIDIDPIHSDILKNTHLLTTSD